MTAQEGMERLEGSMRRDDANRYLFACRKALLLIRIVGARVPLRFDAGDHVAFRIGALDLTVEELETGRARCHFAWERVESLAVGEPETDNRDLFQG
jgi:hypothetical protein